MLSWSLTFFLLAVFAGLLSFEVIASTFVGLAQICFVLFLVGFVLSLVLPRRRLAT